MNLQKGMGYAVLFLIRFLSHFEATSEIDQEADVSVFLSVFLSFGFLSWNMTVCPSFEFLVS